MSKETKCDCPREALWGVQYEWNHPEHYDGVSEWECKRCGARVGAWSGKTLKQGEIERRYGADEKGNLPERIVGLKPRVAKFLREGR